RGGSACGRSAPAVPWFLLCTIVTTVSLITATSMTPTREARAAAREGSREPPVHRGNGVPNVPFRAHGERPAGGNLWVGERGGGRRAAQGGNAPAAPRPRTHSRRSRAT